MSPTVEVAWRTGSQGTVVNLALLILITALALAVHVFHHGIEDGAIYLPAIEKKLNPSLYPSDSIFFCLKQTLQFFRIDRAGRASDIVIPGFSGIDGSFSLDPP